MNFLRGVCVALVLTEAACHAFSLLGPFEDWMDVTNGIRWERDVSVGGDYILNGWRVTGNIGGAMDLNAEYRWNTPIITYGFDQSFLDYFGSNGVVAVDEAVAILNNLPAASNIEPSDFSQAPFGVNYPAQSLNLRDLKSTTLRLLLEQFGLAEPAKNIFNLRHWDPYILTHADEFDWEDWFVDYFLVERNYDPASLAASKLLNGNPYHCRIGVYELNPLRATVLSLPINPLVPALSAAVERGGEYTGEFFTGLSQEDVGGLKYLLSANNVNIETLLPDVQPEPTNASAFVSIASRPGVEKITLVRHPVDSLTLQFTSYTNHYQDHFLLNNLPASQAVVRIVQDPDILFCAADNGVGRTYTPCFGRTGTEGWLNNAILNGTPTNGGPGVIKPPVRISFNRSGLVLYTDDEEHAWGTSMDWGSFNGSTNPPTVYPAGFGLDVTNMDLRVRFVSASHFATWRNQSVFWQLPIPFGGSVTLQTSTNLVSWTTLTSLTNRGTVVDWQHFPTRNQRFFRAILQ